MGIIGTVKNTSFVMGVREETGCISCTSQDVFLMLFGTIIVVSSPGSSRNSLEK